MTEVRLYLEDRLVYVGCEAAVQRRLNTSLRKLREAGGTWPRKPQFRRHAYPGNVVELIPVRPDLTYYRVEIRDD